MENLSLNVFRVFSSLPVYGFNQFGSLINLQGTAEIVFSRRADAAAAVTKYNNVQLDGKPMKVEIVGTNIMAPGPSKRFVLKETRLMKTNCYFF